MSELAQRPNSTVTSLGAGGWSRSQIELVKRTVIRGPRQATDDELALFEYVCRRSQLDPFVGQIWGIIRKEQVGDAWEDRLTVQTGIAGYRLIAERTGRYEGMLGPYWCGPGGEWRDVWLDNQPPAACKVGVLKAGFREPLWMVVTFAEFAQRKRGGELTRFWKQMPANQLAKCARAAAFREAFPQETSGLYVDAEIVADPATGEVVDDQSPGPSPAPPHPSDGPGAATFPDPGRIDALESVQDAKRLVQDYPELWRRAFPIIESEIGVEPRAFWTTADVRAWRRLLGAALEASAADVVAPPAAAAAGPTSPRAAADADGGPGDQTAGGPVQAADGDPNGEGAAAHPGPPAHRSAPTATSPAAGADHLFQDGDGAS